MGNKITIIGAGCVGATIAYTIANSPIASEVVIIDINKNKAEGEALDIFQGTAFRDPINVYAGEYEDAKDSDIVIIASGISRKPGQTRLDLTRTNVGIMKSIAPEIAKHAPNAKYIIVSNPVDILTYVFMKESGIPENQVFGSGTILDTARLRATLANHFSVSPKNIHGFVLGEHGDTSFVPWSVTNISGLSVDEYYSNFCQENENIQPVDCDKIVEYVQKSGGQIIANKGATFYGVSVSVCRLCDYLLSAYDSIATVSTMMHGQYGIEDVCLSLPTIIGPDGVKNTLELELTEEEVAKLHKSATALKEVIKTLEL